MSLAISSPTQSPKLAITDTHAPFPPAILFLNQSLGVYIVLYNMIAFKLVTIQCTYTIIILSSETCMLSNAIAIGNKHTPLPLEETYTPSDHNLTSDRMGSRD